MSVQQTSMDAYLEAKQNINAKQQAVLTQIKLSGASCNQEIAKSLGWEINRVTPRVLELRQKGRIEEAYRDKYSETNRTVIFWREKL